MEPKTFIFIVVSLISILLVSACTPEGVGKFPEEPVAADGKLYFTFEGDVGIPFTLKNNPLIGSLEIRVNSLSDTKYKQNLCEADAGEREINFNWCLGEDYDLKLGHLKMRCKCELS